MKIAVIDNYDSFTYNLVHMLEDIIDREVVVYRNDQLELKELEDFDLLVLSPGPGIPEEAGKLKEIISFYAGKIPMYGVCLGLQAITEVFGGQIRNLDTVFHGVATSMTQTDQAGFYFEGINKDFEAARYHSWVADLEGFPEDLLITAVDSTGEVMAIRHKTFPILAVQFHPESILTPSGYKQLENLVRHYERDTQ